MDIERLAEVPSLTTKDSSEIAIALGGGSTSSPIRYLSLINGKLDFVQFPAER